MLFEVARSVQADLAILMGAGGFLGLLFLALRSTLRWMTRRAWRQQIHEAHRANGRGRETA